MATETPAPLVFEKPIVLIGPAKPDIQLIEKMQQNGSGLVAADGGANRLQDLGIIPTAIIGDMDSVKDRGYWEEITQVIAIDEQDSTDFEKCVYATDAPMYVATGFAADRLDHTLSCLHVMTKYFTQKLVYLVDETTCSFVVSGEITLNINLGDPISIFPLAEINFASSDGLNFPLDGLDLKIGDLVGTSNEAISEEIRIFPASSHYNIPYLVTLPKGHLFPLLKNQF